MQEFNFILYIIFISFFQILINFVFNYLIAKSTQKTNASVNSKGGNVFPLMLSIINSICFMYSLYYLLVFIKTVLLPEFIEIFLSLEPLI